jgi:hypothetical protein
LPGYASESTVVFLTLEAAQAAAGTLLIPATSHKIWVSMCVHGCVVLNWCVVCPSATATGPKSGIGGITKESSERYTLRQGTELGDSPTGEITWKFEQVAVAAKKQKEHSHKPRLVPDLEFEPPVVSDKLKLIVRIQRALFACVKRALVASGPTASRVFPLATKVIVCLLNNLQRFLQQSVTTVAEVAFFAMCPFSLIVLLLHFNTPNVVHGVECFHFVRFLFLRCLGLIDFHSNRLRPIRLMEDYC